MTTVAQALRQLNEDVLSLASQGIRPTVIAVSKRQPMERIVAALEAGHRHFGENQVQEALSKWPQLKQDYPDIVLHLIGPLQSNKVKEAVALFDVIHTIDREKIVDAIATETKTQGRRIECLLQVNIGEEPQKSGVMPAQASALWHYANQAGLTMVGLMAIPPRDEVAAAHFAMMQKTGKSLGAQQLSMGMSNDYKSALRFGATYIRVGTAVFGARES